MRNFPPNSALDADARTAAETLNGIEFRGRKLKVEGAAVKGAKSKQRDADRKSDKDKPSFEPEIQVNKENKAKSDSKTAVVSVEPQSEGRAKSKKKAGVNTEPVAGAVPTVGVTKSAESGGKKKNNEGRREKRARLREYKAKLEAEK